MLVPVPNIYQKLSHLTLFSYIPESNLMWLKLVTLMSQYHSIIQWQLATNTCTENVGTIMCRTFMRIP